MQRILLGVKQVMRQFFVLSLMTLIAFSGLSILVENSSYAVTRSIDKLSADDKVDRAYQFRVGTGSLEEIRQEESPNASQPFDPSDKHKVKSVKASKEENPEPSLPEQVQKVVKKVIGNE